MLTGDVQPESSNAYKYFPHADMIRIGEKVLRNHQM